MKGQQVANTVQKNVLKSTAVLREEIPVAVPGGHSRERGAAPEPAPVVVAMPEAPEASASYSFPTRMGIAVTAASLVAVPLSLGVTVIDRSVTQFANGTAPSLRAAMISGTKTVFRTPHVAFMGLDNRAVFGVYGMTYITKNGVNESCKEYEYDSKWPIFFSTMVVNGALGIMKDKYLAKMFGSGAVNFPMASYLAFVSRDAWLIGVSFVGAPLMGPIVEKYTGLSTVVSDCIAQISVPACGQLIATPIHLAGLDFYNRPKMDFNTRVVDAIKASRGPILVRMFRQGYVFGLGSLSVKYFTKYLMGDE
jgi:hypothetical protein